jgi:hypothetical protein
MDGEVGRSYTDTPFIFAIGLVLRVVDAVYKIG